MKTIKNLFIITGITLIINFNLYSKPVELASFSASVITNDVTLNWTTANETNNERFDIERKRVEATQWDSIGTVAGNGTTSDPHNYSYDDSNLSDGSYNFRLKQVDFNGSFAYYQLGTPVIVSSMGIGNNSELSSDKFRLYQNYPNPFNPNTVISYQLEVNSNVTLKICDIGGNEISTLVNEKQNAGSYEFEFNAANLSSGIYFYKLMTDGFVDTKRMILLK